jgi:septal ring factor EnvC (AmiA/AmiB activator)
MSIDPMTQQDRESRLPQWAQDLIVKLRREVVRLEKRRDEIEDQRAEDREELEAALEVLARIARRPRQAVQVATEALDERDRTLSSPVTDADRDEVAAAGVALGRVPLDEELLDNRDDIPVRGD